MSSDAVLDSIDGALRDHMSADAMRWTPDDAMRWTPDSITAKPEHIFYELTEVIDWEAVARFGREMSAAFSAMTRQVGDAFIPLVKLAGLIAHAALAEDRKHRIRCATCNPAGNPPPFPGGTEYNRRRRARARRRRG